MAEIKLEAQPRDEFGKGAARRIRRANHVPAVLYGHGSAPVHVTLPAHATLLALRQANVLLNIVLPGGASQLALPKQVQRHPLRDTIEHVDLLVVRRGEKVHVEVPLLIVGEPVEDGLINQDRMAVAVLAEATSIPANIEVPVDELAVGTQILLRDLVLPAGVTLAEDADGLVLSIAKARSAADIDAELAEATAGLGEASAEPESDKGGDTQE